MLVQVAESTTRAQEAFASFGMKAGCLEPASSESVVPAIGRMPVTCRLCSYGNGAR